MTRDEFHEIYKKMDNLLGKEESILMFFICPHHLDKSLEGECPEFKSIAAEGEASQDYLSMLQLISILIYQNDSDRR